MQNDLGKKAIEFHKKNKGKIEIKSKADCKDSTMLSLAYTPGVAEVCKEIVADKEKVYELTLKQNSVAVLSDCSRVLGLGKIGAYTGIPVMEGKCALFKSYANIDAFPICLLTYDKEEIIKTAEYISPVFGGINLEDIESPKCFEIEKRLNELLDIPVFHDDQHGTAIVVLAGLINALKLLGKNKREVKVVIAGAGAAGYGITNLLFRYGFENILVCDRNGILVYDEKLPEHKKKLAKLNKNNQSGTIRDALEGADVFIGVSSPNILNQKDIEKMASSPIVFALSNPIPEILPDIARNSKPSLEQQGQIFQTK